MRETIEHATFLAGESDTGYKIEMQGGEQKDAEFRSDEP
jgi:hypothetical protein